MIITQDHLIKQIAGKENMDAATVRDIFRSAEDIIFECLSSTTPAEPITIKLLKGIYLERNYVKKKTYSKGMFQNVDCAEHVNIRANSSRYYSRKANDRLFSRQKDAI